MTLARRVAAFNAARNALLDELERMVPATLTMRPIPAKWSILEQVEHLVLAERSVFRGLPDPEALRSRARRPVHRMARLVVLFVLRFRVPVPVPDRAMLPSGEPRTLDELRRMWDENQVWLAAAIDALGTDGVRGAVLRHPVAGPLTVEQAVQMDHVHLGRHLGQIRRLQRLVAAS